MTTPASLVLRRRPAAAGGWSLLAAALVAAGAYFVADTDGNPFAWGALGLFAVVALYFWVQLAVPGAVVCVLLPDKLRSRAFFRSVEVAWEDVQLARVRRVFGDPALVIDRHDGSRVRVPLPLGADLESLHSFLGARLGRPPDRRPDTDEADFSGHTGDHHEVP